MGREALLEAAVLLLDGTTLADVTARAGVRAVAEQAGVSPSTVSHHFSTRGTRSATNGALAETLIEQTLDRRLAITDSTRRKVADLALAAATSNTAPGMEVLAQIAASNIEDWTQPQARVMLTARYLAYAAAGADPRARRILAARDARLRDRLVLPYQTLFGLLGRAWIEGWDEERFAVVTSALADGFIMRHRFDPSLAPPALYGEVVVHLLDAVSIEQPIVDQPLRRHLAPLPRTSTLDPHKRDAIVNGAVQLYNEAGWSAITVASVAAAAGVNRATVNAHFRNRIGLSAPIFASFLPTLDAAIRADTAPSAITILRNHLERLAAIAQHHYQLTSALLTSWYEPATSGREGSSQAPSPAFVVPIHELVAGLVERERERFRPRYVDSTRSLTQFATFITRSCLSFAVAQLSASPGEVADFIHDTVISGATMRRLRPRRG